MRADLPWPTFPMAWWENRLHGIQSGCGIARWQALAARPWSRVGRGERGTGDQNPPTQRPHTLIDSSTPSSRCCALSWNHQDHCDSKKNSRRIAMGATALCFTGAVAVGATALSDTASAAGTESTPGAAAQIAPAAAR